MSNESPQDTLSFRNLVEAAGCMIVILREDHSVAFFNPFAEQLTGYASYEVLGKDYFPIFLPPEQRASVAEELRRIFSGDQPSRGYECPVRCRDESLCWLAWNARLLTDYEGRPAILAVGHDITEQKEANQRLQAVLNTTVDCIITIDQGGVIQSFNPAAERMFGYQASEVIGRNISLLMPSPHRDEHDSYIEKYLATGEAKIIGIGREVQGQRKDGTLLPIELAVSELQLPDRRLFTGIIRDISERKSAERQLHRLHAAIGDLGEGILITDAQLQWPGPKIVFINPAMTKITGYSPEELIGQSPRVLQGPGSDRQELDRLRQELLAGRAYSGKNVNYRKDGQEYNVELQISPVFDEAGEITNYVSTHRDVTAQKRAEERALQAERLAAIGQTVAGLAHESRNAFQRSQACLEMLALELEEQPEQLELVQRTQRALDHLHHLYEEVRDYAAPIKLDRQPCDLAHIWRDAWSHLEVARQDKQIELFEETGKIDLTCELDWFAMGQVFRNVLENAISACPTPGRIEIRSKRANLHDEEAIQVSVQDNGPGLDPAAKGKVFDAFFTTKTKGTGLGMAIAKRIVEAHGGRMTTGDSATGAEFIVVLPHGAGV